MEKFYFWDIDMDCPIKGGFEGTVEQAKEEAIKLAKKYHVTICIYTTDTHKHTLIVDANGNDLYI